MWLWGASVRPDEECTRIGSLFGVTGLYSNRRMGQDPKSLNKVRFHARAVRCHDSFAFLLLTVVQPSCFLPCFPWRYGRIFCARIAGCSMATASFGIRTRYGCTSSPIG